MSNATKTPIKSLRYLQLLSDFGSVVWETHSLVDSEGDFLEEDFDHAEVCKDIQEWFGFSDKLMKEMINLDMIQIIRDCAGVQICFCRENTQYEDKIIGNIEPVLRSYSEDEDNITYDIYFLNDVPEEVIEQGDDEGIDDATRCGISLLWNQENKLGDKINLEDIIDYEHKGDFWDCQEITWFSIKRK